MNSLLRALASIGVFAEDDRQRFSLTPLAEFLRSNLLGRGGSYLLRHIIHDWDDEKATRILRNVHLSLLYEASGFRLARIVPAQAEISVIEGRKASSKP